MSDEAPSRPRKGAERSFCIPRAAIKALIEARADAVTIGAYLTLACSTDASGQYSTASISAMHRAMSLNKGRAQKALHNLTRITVKGKGKKSTALVYARDAWIRETGEALDTRDGPVERAKVLHVLPDFGEELGERVWFSSNLVQGVGAFRQPLKNLKDAGDATARLLLLMQQAVDMPGWGGVPPSAGPWMRYETTEEADVGPARIIHGQQSSTVMQTGLMRDIAGDDREAAWNAVHALVGGGLFYEIVLVLNRAPVRRQFANGDEYGEVPDDAEPLYELDARSLHGYKPKGEEGLGGFTAKTAGDLGYSVAAGEVLDAHDNPVDLGVRPGQFTGKYAAIVPRGYGAMIVGIYRPRFRVSNPKNAGVKDAWLRIYENNRVALDFVENLRKAKGLRPLKKPSEEPTPEGRAMPDLSEIIRDPYAALNGSPDEPAKPRRSLREADEERERERAQREAEAQQRSTDPGPPYDESEVPF